MISSALPLHRTHGRLEVACTHLSSRVGGCNAVPSGRRCGSGLLSLRGLDPSQAPGYREDFTGPNLLGNALPLLSFNPLTNAYRSPRLSVVPHSNLLPRGSVRAGLLGYRSRWDGHQLEKPPKACACQFPSPGDTLYSRAQALKRIWARWAIPTRGTNRLSPSTLEVCAGSAVPQLVGASNQEPATHFEIRVAVREIHSRRNEGPHCGCGDSRPPEVISAGQH